jgi:gliding motility-associated-like protein
MRRFCTVVLITYALLIGIPCRAQLQIDSSFTPQQLVDSVLLGPGVVAFNVAYTGHPRAVGFFDGTNSNIGLDSGIILTSGQIGNAVGPNNSTFCTSINSTQGDSALTAIAGQPTLDAAILEFDFIPSSDSVEFRYVFASEEYYEGVCTPYNDVFAFLISGPSIPGVLNIATLPITGVPVSISSVNEGYIGQAIYQADSTYPWCYLNNTSYYLDNSSPAGMSVQFDGYTTVLTAKVGVIPCQIYHIRMAIADGGGDNTWDSGVFLEAGSFNARVVTISTNPQVIGAKIDSAGAEGCAILDMIFTRYDSISFPRTLNYTISGTATNGVDYTLSSPTISFLAGDDTFHLYASTIFDAIAETIESVTIKLIPDFIICSGWDTAKITGYIVDQPPLQVNVIEDFMGCPFDSLEVIASGSGGAFGNYYHYSWSPGNSTSSSVWIPSGTTTGYTVVVTDSCGQQSASATYILTDDCDFPMPNIITPDGDAINDFLEMPAEYIASGIRLEIFNRWGNSIYKSDHYDNTWNADGHPDGTYYYIITLVNGAVKYGFITIVR